MRLTWIAYFPIPKRWSKQKFLSAYWHTVKPDRDNIEKLISDSLKGIAWLDDAQVCCGETMKLYARDRRPSGIEIVIEEVER